MNWGGRDFADWLSASPEEFYRRQPMSELLNESFCVLDSARGYAKVRFELNRSHCNYSGRVHGGTIATLLDETIGVAGFIYVGLRFGATIESKISYFRSLQPGPVEVEAWATHLTPNILFAEGQVLNRAGATVAKSTSTIALSKPSARKTAPSAGREADDEAG